MTAADVLLVMGWECTRWPRPMGHSVWRGTGPCGLVIVVMDHGSEWLVEVRGEGARMYAQGRGATLLDAEMAATWSLATVIDGATQLMTRALADMPERIAADIERGAA